jgi:hypothetical protein
MDRKQTAPENDRRGIKRTIKVIVPLLLVFLILVYLFLVFIKAHTRSSNYLRMTPKPGYARPEIPNACKQILSDTSLNPYANIRPKEFREYGNLWLLDNGKTLMYKSSLMDHPQCLNVVMQRMMATKMHYILVIYDCEKQSEVLIVRNYGH